MAAHLETDRYGAFLLTDAIRPARHVPVVPREGWRRDVFRDAESGLSVPVLLAAVSRERLFDVFLGLLPPLGETVDVVLETSHEETEAVHRDLVREGIDLAVAMSHFCDEEELLLNDGCTGVAVIGQEGRAEVQFDEHKLLAVYADDLGPYEAVLRRAGVPRVEGLRFLTEGEHLHSTTVELERRFEELCQRLGIEAEVLAGWR
ncbi:MAG: hypothetical protein K2W96_22010 [Gemmataceae bacterium]|nr:hypothetical protein [Gemmataceae bacterium]